MLSIFPAAGDRQPILYRRQPGIHGVEHRSHLGRETGKRLAVCCKTLTEEREPGDGVFVQNTRLAPRVFDASRQGRNRSFETIHAIG